MRKFDLLCLKPGVHIIATIAITQKEFKDQINDCMETVRSAIVAIIWTPGFTIVLIAEFFSAIVAIPAIIWTPGFKKPVHGREIGQKFTVKCQSPWVCTIPPAAP